ncbi:MAG TPA: hypothetical protein VFD28_04010 [Candidatus Eisenbacteria bacterium]|nr:hypothetical protein [Candidatus Eisenbacteria bacterium]
MTDYPNLHKRLSLIFSFCLALFIFIQVFSPVILEAETQANLLSENFNPDIDVNNVLAISTEFDKVLFSQQASSPLPLPAANHFMLSLLVAEQLNLDQRITISENALSYAEPNSYLLSTNLDYQDNILISNLLAMHMYAHSQVAAVALAEELTGSIDKTLEKMNQRAKELGMTNTNFTNISGQVTLKDDHVWDSDFNLIDDANMLAQKSSLEDISILMKVMNKNNLISQMFNDGDYLTRLADDTVIALHHPYKLIFATTEEGISGGWALQQDGMSFSMVLGEIDQIKYMILMTDKTESSFAVNMVDLIKKIDSYYTVSSLVSQNQIYPSYDQTTEGDQIGLMFLKTINYIHPNSENFLSSTVKYVSYGPHSRPLARGTPVGHVVFTLNDGSQIEAEVGSDLSILSSNSFVSRFMSSIQQNPNLGRMILILSLALAIILIVKIRHLILALSHQIKLFNLNKLQKGLKDRIKKS